MENDKPAGKFLEKIWDSMRDFSNGRLNSIEYEREVFAAHEADVAEKIKSARSQWWKDVDGEIKKAVEAERGRERERCARKLNDMAELSSFRDESRIYEIGAAALRASKEQQ